jgi:hypothetical protein
MAEIVGEVHRLKAVLIPPLTTQPGRGAHKRRAHRANNTGGCREVIGVRSLFVKIFFAEIVGQHTHFEIGGARGVKNR